MNKIFLVCCTLLSMACLADSKQKSMLHELDGIWQGVGKQDDHSDWTIKLTIAANQYLIDYPSLNCGGKLELLTENANILVFREALTYGVDRCINNGKTILIKTTDNKLRYHWYYEGSGKKGAVGLLSR